MTNNFEKIKFEIWLGCEFWDQPPVIEILIDNELKFSNEMKLPEICKIEFFQNLAFDQPHLLEIKRSGKSDSQCLVSENKILKDQVAWIEKIVIDGVDVQNLIWSQSWFVPDYPEPWAAEQKRAGVELEEKVISGTIWGHNGIWSLGFTSPFYKFLFDCMN